MRRKFAVSLQMRDPSYEDSDGLLYPGDLDAISKAVWHADPSRCNHKRTLCAVCVNDWAYEYFGFVWLRCPDSGRTVAVDLDVMADAFNTSVHDFKKTYQGLIKERKHEHTDNHHNHPDT